MPLLLAEEERSRERALSRSSGLVFSPLDHVSRTI